MSYQVDPNHTPASFEPIPAGTYEVIVASADWKTAQSGGRYVNVRLDVTEGQYAKRVIFWRCNLESVSPDPERQKKAREIANDQMHAFCLSAGISGWEHPADLVGLTVNAVVRIGKAQAGYDAQNEISTFKWDPAGAPPAAPRAQAQAAPTTSAPRKAGWA